MLEAGYHGVPMICVPFFGDQFDNCVTAKHVGMGEVLYKEQMTEENLANAINTVLNNSRLVEDIDKRHTGEPPVSDHPKFQA